MTEETKRATDNAPPPANWYQKGFGGLAQEQARMESGGEPPWFWLKEDEERHVTLLDDEPTGIYMHEYKLGGQFGLHCTCVRDIYETAPCCELLQGDKTRVYMSLFPIVDLDGYKPKKGPPVKNVLSILAAKYKTARIFEQEKKDEVSLIGRRLRVKRIGKKAPRSGDNVKCLSWVFGQGENARELKYLDEALWHKLFMATVYRGKKLPELIAAANADPAKKAAFARVFDTTGVTNPDGAIRSGKIPPFNFLKLYEPKRPAELVALLRGATVSDFGDGDAPAGGAAAEGGASGGSRSDDVPF